MPNTGKKEKFNKEKKTVLARQNLNCQYVRMIRHFSRQARLCCKYIVITNPYTVFNINSKNLIIQIYWRGEGGGEKPGPHISLLERKLSVEMIPRYCSN